LDENQHIITSNYSPYNFLNEETLNKTGRITSVNNKLYQWLPSIKKPIMVRWKRSLYLETIYFDYQLPFRLSIQVPLYTYIERLEVIYLEKFRIYVNPFFPSLGYSDVS
jgi:hypothetical protein